MPRAKVLTLRDFPSLPSSIQLKEVLRDTHLLGAHSKVLSDGVAPPLSPSLAGSLLSPVHFKPQRKVTVPTQQSQAPFSRSRSTVAGGGSAGSDTEGRTFEGGGDSGGWPRCSTSEVPFLCSSSREGRASILPRRAFSPSTKASSGQCAISLAQESHPGSGIVRLNWYQWASGGQAARLLEEEGKCQSEFRSNGRHRNKGSGWHFQPTGVARRELPQSSHVPTSAPHRDVPRGCLPFALSWAAAPLCLLPRPLSASGGYSASVGHAVPQLQLQVLQPLLALPVPEGCRRCSSGVKDFSGNGSLRGGTGAGAAEERGVRGERVRAQEVVPAGGGNGNGNGKGNGPGGEVDGPDPDVLVIDLGLDEDAFIDELTDEVFDSLAADLDDEEGALESAILMQDVRGVPGLPPLEELLHDPTGEEEEQEQRRRRERHKEEEQREARVRAVDALGRAYGTGRRKTSSARVWLEEGQGRLTVNGCLLDLYFPAYQLRGQVLSPFVATDTLGAFDVSASVKGGGVTGQAGAIQLGISRALQNFDPTLRPRLKKEGLLQRDPRMVERKKPGKAKARKSFQWVKR